jgi:beta-glucanase (GH16 family)
LGQIDSDEDAVKPSLAAVAARFARRAFRLGTRAPIAVAPAFLLLLIASQANAEGERLIHAEDFSVAKAYDASFWTAETGFFRNGEAQYYQPGNVTVTGGLLILEGRRESAPNAAYDPQGADWLTTTKSADYTSGSLVSKQAFRYGVFEVVARLPAGAGTWPAIWTVDETSGPYREIDIVEAVGHTPGKAFSTVYAGKDMHHLAHWSAQTAAPDIASAFHTYRLDWRRERIIVSIDGREALNVSTDGVDPLRWSMRLRLNLALGGSWGGKIDDTALPARVEIKSIKIWDADPTTD